MATPRPELYKCFGPELIHALVVLLVEQLNILRANDGLSAITKTQVELTLRNKFDELTAELEVEM